MIDYVHQNAINSLIKLQELKGGKPILHFGSLAGWPHTVARVGRKLGVDSENVVHVYKDVLDLDRKLPFDKSVFLESDGLAKKIIKNMNFLLNIPNSYSLVHYHSTTLLHREYHFLFEGPYLNRKKIPQVLSLGGGDARIDRAALDANPYYYKTPQFWHDLRIKLRWLSWSKNVAVCATDPEMAVIAQDYFENVKIFRQPVELAHFESKPPAVDCVKPIILHVPTNPHIKGTKYVLEAIENLKAKGLNFEFKMVRQLTQTQFFDELLNCDIYVDELRCGGHGMTAVEAMAMGKPTISYIREDLLGKYPDDLPLVNSNPDLIEETLERLILNAESRHAIGVASRRYVEKYHDADLVFGELSDIYAALLRNVV